MAAASVDRSGPSGQPFRLVAGDFRYRTAVLARPGDDPETAGTGVETALERAWRTMPWTVLATDDFAQGVDRMPRSIAVRRREISPDAAGWLRELRFDVDGSDAATRWIDAGLPPPNLIVRNKANGHAHLIYHLGVWIPTEDHGPSSKVKFSPKAVRYAASIDAAMTAALGADVAYAGRFTHNPLHDGAWETREARAQPYSLTELAAYVDLHDSTQQRTAPTSSGLGRNVATFDRLRKWAYRAIKHHIGGRRDAWDAAVYARAASIAADVRSEYGTYVGGSPYRDSEVRATAKSVARWTWTRYTDRTGGAALEETRSIVEAEKARIRAEKARRTRGNAPRALYVAAAGKRRTEATAMRAAGISARTIAAKLGVSLSEVYRLLRQTVTAVAVRVQGPSRAQNLQGVRAPLSVASPVEPPLPFAGAHALTSSGSPAGSARSAASTEPRTTQHREAVNWNQRGVPAARDGGPGEGTRLMRYVRARIAALCFLRATADRDYDSPQADDMGGYP